MAAGLLQDTLFDFAAEQEPPARRRPVHEPRPRRDKEFLAQPCDPVCIVCGKKEGGGRCDRCAIACVHAREPDLVEVCLAADRVTARIVSTISLCDGHRHQLAVVDCCPSCGEMHWHAPTFGARYRVGRCGRPYVVILRRPKAIEEVTHGQEQRDATARGAELARELLARDEQPTRRQAPPRLE
ncbi:hypothetical protein [Nonomuraea wenchangensis]|uniref:hypothetical protein n=1 Tax=Nonomuraea wenchangensis TaxID=568860 RepID=UPI003318BE49